MKNKNTIKKVGAVALMIGLLAATGIGAYLTDTDVKTDTYTIGHIDINNNFEALNTMEMVPLDVVEYTTANISNIGISDAYVFMTVDIPVTSVYIHEADGSGITGPDTKELFVMSGRSADWVQIGESIHIYDESYNHVFERYVFAYGTGSLKVLECGNTTSDVFTSLQLINLADRDANGQSVDTGNLENAENIAVRLNAYGIQANGLKANDAASVWNIVRNAFSISD